MFYDLLVHVDLPDESRFVMALGNISNYLAALNGEPCTVVLLANGGAARSSPGKTTRKPKPSKSWPKPGFPSACAPTP